jgi:hypothetical protein
MVSHRSLLPPRRCKPNLRLGDSSGFALIVVLLVLVGLTGIATAGFLQSSTDYSLSANHFASVHAFYAADEGLSEAMGRNGIPQDSLFMQLPNFRTTTVVSEKLLDLGSGRNIYRVRAVGRRVDGRGEAIREVSALSVFVPYPLEVNAALTSPSGLLKTGSDGTVSGFDASAPGSCPGAGATDVAGVAVPPGGYTQTGKPEVPTGDPGVEDSKTGDQLVAESIIDWAGLVSESAFQPDYVIPGDSWPDFSSLGSDEWPLIHVTSDFESLQPTQSGRGVIIFDHDVKLEGSFSWDGILLIGGVLTSSGNNTVNGSVFTGLNRVFGEPIPPSDLGNGEKTFQYHYCNVQAAKNALGWMATMPGTWSEEQ